MAEHALACPEGPQGLSVLPPFRRTEVVVHVDAPVLTREAEGGRCAVERGTRLPVETVRRLGCDALRSLLVEDEAGLPLWVGRRSRTAPPALRRALLARDGGRCRFPGCHHERHLHVHHVVHWADGGETSLLNTLMLCARHHRMLHEEGYAVRGEPATPGGFGFYAPDGEPLVVRPLPGGDLESLRRANAHLELGPHTIIGRNCGEPMDRSEAVGILRERTTKLHPYQRQGPPPA
jgi:hypothetical protein